MRREKISSRAFARPDDWVPPDAIVLSRADVVHALEGFVPEDPDALVRWKPTRPVQPVAPALDQFPVDPGTISKLTRIRRALQALAVLCALAAIAVAAVVLRPSVVSRSQQVAEGDDSNPPIVSPPMDEAAVAPLGHLAIGSTALEPLRKVVASSLRSRSSGDGALAASPFEAPLMAREPTAEGRAAAAAPPIAAAPIETAPAPRELLAAVTRTPSVAALPPPPPTRAPIRAPAPPVPVEAARTETTPAEAERSLVAVENSEIEAVLERYRVAFNALDAGAAHAVWTTADVKGLGRAFNQLEEQQLTFDACVIAISGAEAVANCQGSASYVPRVGHKSRRVEQRGWRFGLRKTDTAWLIDAVTAR